MLDTELDFDWTSASRVDRSAYIERERINGTTYDQMAEATGVKRNSILGHTTRHMRAHGYTPPTRLGPIRVRPDVFAPHAPLKDRPAPKPPANPDVVDAPIRFIDRVHNIQCAAIVAGESDDGMALCCGSPIERGQYCGTHAAKYYTGFSS